MHKRTRIATGAIIAALTSGWMLLPPARRDANPMESVAHGAAVEPPPSGAVELASPPAHASPREVAKLVVVEPAPVVAEQPREEAQLVEPDLPRVIEEFDLCGDRGICAWRDTFRNRCVSTRIVERKGSLMRIVNPVTLEAIHDKWYERITYGSWHEQGCPHQDLCGMYYLWHECWIGVRGGVEEPVVVKRRTSMIVDSESNRGLSGRGLGQDLDHACSSPLGACGRGSYKLKLPNGEVGAVDYRCLVDIPSLGVLAGVHQATGDESAGDGSAWNGSAKVMVDESTGKPLREFSRHLYEVRLASGFLEYWGQYGAGEKELLHRIAVEHPR